MLFKDVDGQSMVQNGGKDFIFYRFLQRIDLDNTNTCFMFGTCFKKESCQSSVIFYHLLVSDNT